jgi:hypothetical protein
VGIGARPKTEGDASVVRPPDLVAEYVTYCRETGLLRSEMRLIEVTLE